MSQDIPSVCVLMVLLTHLRRSPKGAVSFHVVICIDLLLVIRPSTKQLHILNGQETNNFATLMQKPNLSFWTEFSVFLFVCLFLRRGQLASKPFFHSADLLTDFKIDRLEIKKHKIMCLFSSSNDACCLVRQNKTHSTQIHFECYNQTFVCLVIWNRSVPHRKPWGFFSGWKH